MERDDRKRCTGCGERYYGPHPVLCLDCYSEQPASECPCPHTGEGWCLGNYECDSSGPCQDCEALERRARRRRRRAVKGASRP